MKSKRRIITHESGMKIRINLHGAELSDADRTFIQTLHGTIYHNDLECYHWMFDQRMPSGRWLENIHPANDLRTAVACVG